HRTRTMPGNNRPSRNYGTRRWPSDNAVSVSYGVTRRHCVRERALCSSTGTGESTTLRGKPPDAPAGIAPDAPRGVPAVRRQSPRQHAAEDPVRHDRDRPARGGGLAAQLLAPSGRQTDPLRRLRGHVGAPQDVAEPQDMSESQPDGQTRPAGGGRSSEMPASSYAASHRS